MPEAWENKVKELGAFVRGRKIKSAVELLRVVCLSLTEGKFFSGTAVLLQRGAMGLISKKAVCTRFQTCGEWHRWRWEHLYRNNEEAPVWLGDRKVYLVDARDEPVPGSDTADYRLQYALGLFDLRMKEMGLTATEPGEKAGHFKSFGAKDVVLGERAYCSKPEIAYL
jgi:hypothetical protein